MCLQLETQSGPTRVSYESPYKSYLMESLYKNQNIESEFNFDKNMYNLFHIGI